MHVGKIAHSNSNHLPECRKCAAMGRKAAVLIAGAIDRSPRVGLEEREFVIFVSLGGTLVVIEFPSLMLGPIFKPNGRILCYAICSTARLAVACSCLCYNISTRYKALRLMPLKHRHHRLSAPCSDGGACQATPCESWTLCKT